MLVYAGMVVCGSSYFTQIRKAAGAEYVEGMKKQPPLPPQMPEEIAMLILISRAMELVAIGGVGLLILLWLMMFKPF